MNIKISKTLTSGYLFALVATIIWSGNFVVARGLTESVPPISLAFWRWVVAIVVFLPLALPSLIREWTEIRKNLEYLAITSILGVTLFNTLIYIASHSTDAINLSLISITFPIFVILFSWAYFGENITVNKGAGIIIVATGILVLVTRGNISSIVETNFSIGDLWMLGAANCFAIYSILIKQKPHKISTLSLQVSTFIFGLIFLFPFYVWESITSDFKISSANINTLYAIFYIGFFASLIAFLLWGKAIDILGPTTPSLIYYTLPIFSGLAAYVFLDEQIGAAHFLSMAIIIVGVLTAIYVPKKHKQQNKALQTLERPHTTSPSNIK
ncbi:DMT family transporter [Marinobacterium arenosum]|uniref:DMT family transporter n=1 Tax=Marinobacterium arenosum TaxID=2862496 RepID=UPI001C958A8F|nr:DMT family transporter [Marinobacterium arenosum]MBY4675488.1 DMT family transporter [Marinobacterium arenosum]